MTFFDRALFALLKWRMSRCAVPGDAADQLGDKVLALTNLFVDELKRRNERLENWQRAARAVQAARSERRQFFPGETEQIRLKETL